MTAENRQFRIDRGNQQFNLVLTADHEQVLNILWGGARPDPKRLVGLMAGRAQVREQVSGEDLDG
jgi:hypothetical protein